jgi:hypothetical protein
MLRRPAKQPNQSEVFNVNNIDDLEDQIGELISQEVPRRPLQDYTPPTELTALVPPIDIGTVTAEAVMTQYEAAAKTIEGMKAPLQEWTKECQTALADLQAAMTYIDETAKRFREIGEQTHQRIQKSSVALAEVRKICDEIRAKIDPSLVQS